jgi:hypothetical protein
VLVLRVPISYGLLQQLLENSRLMLHVPTVQKTNVVQDQSDSAYVRVIM